MSGTASLNDKYTAERGVIFLSGSQAIVRVCLQQVDRDRAVGKNVGGFISGYRGSPLGNIDGAFQSAGSELPARDIVLRTGLNEEIAATSCWGTQQLGQFPNPKKDGVFAVWYGKGPGVDRAGDALKHGNLAGTAAYGGVVVLAGDDHSAKSSTTAHQSEQALIAAMIPVLYPASVQDIIDFGGHAIAASRFSGLWVGLKCVTEVVESASTCVIDNSWSPELPSCSTPPGGFHIGRPFNPLGDEAHLIRYRLPAVQAYVRSNRLDRVIIDGEKRGLGIIAAGKAFADVMQALRLLEIDEDAAQNLGLRLYKPAMVWPIEPEGLRAFASSHKELLIIEEKRSVLGAQISELLFNLPAGKRPVLSGKCDPNGSPLLPSDGELTPQIIADAVSRRLGPELRTVAGGARISENRNNGVQAPNLRRTPAFCSGCPHNRSTKVPDGSIALAGIGCHSMAMFMPDRPTLNPTQMGGEGANWIGAAPFSGTSHVFQNLGDGTYFHSGILAIRASVAAGVNITYKILYNDAVAMTGGQPVDGELTVPRIVAQTRAEGVANVVIVTDEPEKYKGIAIEAKVHPRSALIVVERQLQETPGTTVLIYDQVCAAEKRRRRKRGNYPDPQKRVFINESVCEGCGDCGVQSSCVAIQPLETSFGRKRRIDQSSCNKDFSCIEGFCPSFVTVLGGKLRSGGSRDILSQLDERTGALEPLPYRALERPYAVLVAGIGGTGVVTIGAVLGMAAKIDGIQCSILDITGLSQKNGPVLSHVRFTPESGLRGPTRIGKMQADAVIGCDLVVAGSPEVLEALRTGETDVVVNDHMTATAEFRTSPDLRLDADEFLDVLGARSRSVMHIDATAIAEQIFGNHIAANTFLMGLAYQKGHLPLSERAILDAIRLNGVAVDMNRRAFQLGRLAGDNPSAFSGIVEQRGSGIRADKLDELIAKHRDFLTAYQSPRYADQYRRAIERIRGVENRIVPGGETLTETAARALFKLMAYKDEYEVARLHVHHGLRDKLNAEFEGRYHLQYNFSPPLFARRDPVTGIPRKYAFGEWIEPLLRLLSHARVLRGTIFDVFGHTEERKMERAQITAYIDLLDYLQPRLTPENLPLVIELASIPLLIRGFGHIKRANVEHAKRRQTELLSKLFGTDCT